MHRVENDSNEAAASLMNGTSKNVTGHDCESLCHSTTADRAAMGMAQLFGHDRDPCGMHDSDKVAKSAIGDLVRTKDKVQINPFPAIINKAHKMAAHFSHGNCILKLKNRSNTCGGPEIKLQLD